MSDQIAFRQLRSFVTREQERISTAQKNVEVITTGDWNYLDAFTVEDFALIGGTLRALMRFEDVIEKVDKGELTEAQGVERWREITIDRLIGVPVLSQSTMQAANLVAAHEAAFYQRALDLVR